METSKLGFVQTAVPEGSVAVTVAAAAHEAAAADRMHVQAPLTTLYVRTMAGSPQPAVPLLPPPPPPVVSLMQPTQAPLQAASLQEASAITLPISAITAKQPVLAFHIAGGAPLTTTQTFKSGGAVMPTGVAPCPSKPPKSVGKHVCHYCGRDCLKPSVLEKHLRCHTGERPYPCTICGVSFKTQSNLYKHKRTQAHARISSESDRGSLSSQESLHSSRDTCFSSSLSLEAQNQDCSSQDGYEFAAKQRLGTAESESVQTHPVPADTQGSGTARALQQAALVGLIAAPMEVQKDVFTSQTQQVTPPCGVGVITAGRDPKRLAVGDGPRPCSGVLLTPNRHLPLQRQEATLSPKSWDSMSISKGKSQSHDSTDSGFSDSGEHHWTSSPGSSPHEHSMESLVESNMEVADPQPVSPVETDPTLAGGSKSKVSVQEKKQLEERISKIISKNDALMDDKHLENVRPRKTVLSKQGSIDLPMPYTYKDSFHFEMKSATSSSSITTSKQASVSPGPDKRGIQAFCSSLPSQHAGSLDHAPLTRSSSLPFTVSEQQSDTAGMASPHHTDRVTLSRRSSAGHLHLHSVKLGAQSMDQQGPSHRSLVRQVAVDCLPEVSPTDRGSLSSLNSDTDCTDTAGESPTARKCRRKRSQKFDYNKWYVYGDGTFRKLYGTSSEKELDPSLLKAQKSLANSLEQRDEREDIQISQVRDLVSGTQVVVSTTDMSVGTMQSVPCPSISPGVGLTPAGTTCSDRRHSMNVSSYVLLQGPMLKNTGPSQQKTESRVVLGTDVISPKGSSIDQTNCEVVPQHSTLPSERKKQRTEENVCIVLNSMNTRTREENVAAYKIGRTDGDVTNGVNQTLAPTGREHSRPRVQRQDSLVSPHVTPRQPLQKRHSSPLFTVNVSRPSELVIASSTTTATITTMSLPVKSSFLPKYQLKLPQTSANGESCPRHTATYMRHSFSSSQIFTTCAPRSGHSDSITSFTTLTQSQPITPITLIHSQQSKFSGNTRLNALGLPVPMSTWSPSPTVVGGLMHNSCQAQNLRTTSDTTWTPQRLAMVTPAISGQSYMCKTVLAQDQFGSITTPRHSQSATAVISYNQTAPTGKLCPVQCADISDTGTPIPVHGHIQQMAVVTVLAQKPTSTPTTGFSTNRLIKSVTGVTLDQTTTLLPVQCQNQQVTPVAGLNQNTPVIQTTVFSGNQPVRDASLSQTPLPVPLQYQTQQTQPTSSVSAKPITMYATSQPVKYTGEMSFSQIASSVTVPCQIQALPGLAQKLPVTATTNFSTSQSVKHLTDLSVNQTIPVVVQQQMQGLTAVTHMEQRGPVTSTRIVSNCQATRPGREISFSQAPTASTVQYHTAASNEPIREVTNISPQQTTLPVTVQYVIQQATTPITVLSQKPTSTPITTSSLSPSGNPVTDMAIHQGSKPAAAQHHIQQPTPIAPTQPATPAIVESHWQSSTAVSSVRSQCQTAMAATCVGNSQTTSPIAVMPMNQPALPAAAVVKQLQTTCPPTGPSAKSDPCAFTATVQTQDSKSMKAPPQFAMNAPKSSAPCPPVDIGPEVRSTTGIPKEITNGGGVGQPGGVPQASAQDTFFMRTPDLQIVMQLISDEQLALMAPQIEAVDYKQGAGCPSGEASKTDTSGQPSLVTQGLDVNACKTNNSNAMNSTQGGAIPKIMLTNGPTIMAQSSCATSVSPPKPSCQPSIFMNSNPSLPERPCQSQASVIPATAQNLYISDQPMHSQATGFEMRDNRGVGQRECIPAQPVLSEKDSTIEQGSMEAHITVHKQQLPAWPTSPSLHNPTIQGCISKAPESHPQSSGQPSSVTTEKAYPPTTQKSLPNKVGAPAAYQESHLSAVPVGSTVPVRNSAPVTALRVADVKPQSPLLSACHTSSPAVHCPSVPHHSPISEKTGSSHSVFLPGTVPCLPNVSGTSATAQANPQHCELDLHRKPQAAVAEDQLGQTISVSTGMLASELDQTPPLGMTLSQPSGSLQILSEATGRSQLNGSFIVLSGMGEKNSSDTLTHQVGSGSGLHTSQHKLSSVACISPVPLALAQSMGVGSTSQHPAAGQRKPLCPGNTQDGCNLVTQSGGSTTVAGVPGKTSGEPQQSQQAIGVGERHQPPTTGCQGDARNMGVEPSQACLQREGTPRVEEMPCSSLIRADQGMAIVIVVVLLVIDKFPLKFMCHFKSLTRECAQTMILFGLTATCF